MSHHDHHHNNHHHDHAHSHDEMTIDKKLAKLLEHWIKHNSDHANTYRQWADRANENNLPEIGGLLEEVAEITIAMNEKFEAAEKLLPK